MKTTEDRTYIAIDLKSFYASVECRERGLDPLDANLVVADPTRTDKTICLAVSPSLKAHGISGRARLFEAIERVRQVNAVRRSRAPGGVFSGSSYLDSELKRDPSLELGFITAPPRMGFYIEYSTRIYKIYLKYAAPEDIHVYSIDEVFIDATDYMRTRSMSGRDFAMMIVRDILSSTGITATVGIGSNLYLAKIAMDIVAKRMSADADGVRIAELDEMSYRRELWDHRPLTDFWRVGAGIARKLEGYGMYTMGDVARCSLGRPGELHSEELLYRLFGVNAELLIDHAWGWEGCRISDIKAYRPASHSISSGQVLMTPYGFDKADAATDRYGRRVPKSAHGTARLDRFTSSTRLLTDAVLGIFDGICDSALSVRRINIAVCEVKDESFSGQRAEAQMDLFSDPGTDGGEKGGAEPEGEKKRQRVMLDIKKKYGKNAILKGTSLEKGATTIQRNRQIGGHKA